MRLQKVKNGSGTDELGRELSKRIKSKNTTRQDLMDTALNLVYAGDVFSNLSLRQVTKETGVVPAAFYRHFKGMDELGNSLIEVSFHSLKEMLINLLTSDSLLKLDTKEFITTYVDNLDGKMLYLRFVVSEYFGSSSKLRSSVRKEMQILKSEIAIDIARLYPNKNLSRRDLQLLAEMCIQYTVLMSKKVIEFHESKADSSEERNVEMIDSLATQLRIILLGIHHWDNARS